MKKQPWLHGQRTTSKASKRRQAVAKPKAPEAPRLPVVPRLDAEGQQIDYFSHFEETLRKRGYSREMRRKILSKVSRGERAKMAVEVVPASAIDPRQVCGSCGQPMSEEFHPAASGYLCAGLVPTS